MIFARNFIKNKILRNKIQKTYILHTNKFGEENGKYYSQKTKLEKYLQKYVFQKQIEGNEFMSKLFFHNYSSDNSFRFYFYIYNDYAKIFNYNYLI